MNDIFEQQKAQFLKAYDELHDAIFRYIVMKISSRERAVDLVQETFTRTWEYITRGETIDNLKSLLYRIAHNLVVDEYRKRKESSLDNLLEEGFDYADQSIRSPETSFDAERVIMLARTLDDKYRDAVLMRYVDDLSIGEIATILGESENNVSVRIHRGVQKLKEILRDNSYE
jgi:RNA polymerase sigma-70 factor (ECF subfamily)